MNREELIEEAAAAIFDAADLQLAPDDQMWELARRDARAVLAVFEKAQAPTDDERHWSDAAASAYPGDEYDNADLRTAFGRGVKWERRRPAQTEPTDAQVSEAMNAALTHYLNAGVDLMEAEELDFEALRAALRAAFTAGQEDKP